MFPGHILGPYVNGIHVITFISPCSPGRYQKDAIFSQFSQFYGPCTSLNKEEIPVTFYLSHFGWIENACLKAHNDRRALHGAGPLIWDDTLVKHAQVWADHLAATGKIRHDPDRDVEGENLAWFQGHLSADCTNALKGW